MFLQLSFWPTKTFCYALASRNLLPLLLPLLERRVLIDSSVRAGVTVLATCVATRTTQAACDIWHSLIIGQGQGLGVAVDCMAALQAAKL